MSEVPSTGKGRPVGRVWTLCGHNMGNAGGTRQTIPVQGDVVSYTRLVAHDSIADPCDE